MVFLKGNIKAHSYDPISRIRFSVPKIGCRGLDGPIAFVGAFHLSRKCGMKIEHVLFPSVFFKIMDPCVRRSHDPIFGINKNWILEIGSCEWALT